MRVFLTGGSGLLGSHTAQHLVQGDHHVVALCRRHSDTRFLEELGCELVRGDVRDGEDVLAPPMEGCTHLVHSAALVYTGGSWPKIRAVNVDGTRHVLAAAVQAGVGRAVHISSVAVYGNVDGPVDETSPVDGPLPPTDLYARSKREAEVVARQVESEHGLAVTVLRPAAVYGERDRLMAPSIGRMTSGPVAFLLGSGGNTLPAVYAGNVATAVGLALQGGGAGSTYDVGMDHPITQRMLLEELAVGLERAPRLIRVPASLVRAGAAVLKKLGVAPPGTEHLPLDRVVRLALGENPYPSRRIRQELGWDPPYGHRDALRRTGRWLRDHRNVEEERRKT